MPTMKQPGEVVERQLGLARVVEREAGLAEFLQAVLEVHAIVEEGEGVSRAAKGPPVVDRPLVESSCLYDFRQTTVMRLSSTA
jgi:hypothetical protein